ncbi:hypothetical protein [Actinomadura macra]|uniref:hypothetical protein n=1 Tax=Actinomadura macra TaxID=46164 RepID=UPI00082D3DC2|nr:hypothetical protein [Actinomadura macra]
MPAQTPTLTDHRSQTRDALTRRLIDEFDTFSADAVYRCVSDVHARITHLGLDATPDSVERMAREHLLGMLKSEPPSGRANGSGGDGDG